VVADRGRPLGRFGPLAPGHEASHREKAQEAQVSAYPLDDGFGGFFSRVPPPPCIKAGCRHRARYRCDQELGRARPGRGKVCGLPICSAHVATDKDGRHFCPNHSTQAEQLDLFGGRR